MKGITAITGRMDRMERFLVCLTGILMLLACVLPLWQVSLRSQQYPEGLKLIIHPQHITGNVQSINILNHYIGMKPISDAAFPEFTWMMPALASLGAVLLLSTLLGRREGLFAGRLMLLGFDGYMLWDLYHWMYDWGHQLDPHAAIRVAPFTPPLLGFKHVANFLVLSFPSWGGVCVMLASFIGVYTLWYAVRRSS